jgi:murein DD-endopeptidase MepM/ murein hydrolase activator NlpD
MIKERIMITTLLNQQVCKRKHTITHIRIYGGSEAPAENKGDNSQLRKQGISNASVSGRPYKKRSVVKRIIIVAAILFSLCGVFTMGREIIAGSSGTLDIRLPEQSDIVQMMYDTIISEDIREEQEYPPSTNMLNTLSVIPHTVRKNETISHIAQKYNISVDTIISYNKITSVYNIVAGMKLLIPNTSGIPYTVRKGDSLSLIAQKHSIGLNSLLDCNNIRSSVIKPGDVLYIPGAHMNPYELRKVLGTLFTFPAKGRITSGYGYRIHPISGKRHFHNGIDIANNLNTPVRAALDGRIQKIGYNHTYGRYIILKHDMGFQTFYGHLRHARVTNGAWVSQGDIIGDMGNTGYSTGTHLHFSIYKNGDTIDPLRYLK